MSKQIVGPSAAAEGTCQCGECQHRIMDGQARQEFDADDVAEIEIYKEFRKWRATQSRPRVSGAYRAGYQAGAASQFPQIESWKGFYLSASNRAEEAKKDRDIEIERAEKAEAEIAELKRVIAEKGGEVK